MMALEVVVFFHYFLVIRHSKTDSDLITIQQLLCSASQLILCYIYCRDTSRLLDNPKVWLVSLQIIGLLSFALQCAIEIYDIIQKHNEGNAVYLGCKTPHYVFVNASQSLILCFFLFVGCILIFKLNHYEPKSELEKELHEKNKIKYLRHLYTCLFTMLALIVVSNAYAILLYLSANCSCTKVTSQRWLN
jgi:hypothetical protein